MSSDADKMWAEMTGGTSPKPAAKPATPPASTPTPAPRSAASDTELFLPRAAEAKPASGPANKPAATPAIPAAAIYVAGAVVVAVALALIVWMLTSKRSAPTPPPAPVAGGNPAQTAPTASTPSRAGMINLNTATAAQLRTLPDIGPAMADKIIDYRTKNGPFRSVDQLDSVSGIGPKTLAKLRPLVYVE